MLFSSAAGVARRRGAGQLRGGERIPGCAGARGAGAGLAGAVAGVGAVGAGERHDRRSRRGRPGADGAPGGGAALLGARVWRCSIARRAWARRCWWRRAWIRGAARAGASRGAAGVVERAGAGAGPARRGGAAGSLARRLAGVPEQRVGRDGAGGRAQPGGGRAGARLGRAVDPQRAFKDLGFDSLGAVELRNRLSRRRVCGCRRRWCSTIRAAPRSRRCCGPGGGRRRRRGRARGRGAPGRGGRADRDRGDELPLPGAARTPQELWELVAGGGMRSRGFPADRGWDLEALYDPDPDRPGTSYTRTRAGSSTTRASSTRASSGSGPREALAMDPQQRLLLEGAWEALEDAGIDPVSLRGSQTGVFAGTIVQDYGTPRMPRRRGGGLSVDRRPAAACCPAGWRTRSGSRARRCRSIRRAPRRWWRCTWPVRRCATGSARWRWRAA